MNTKHWPNRVCGLCNNGWVRLYNETYAKDITTRCKKCNGTGLIPITETGIELLELLPLDKPFEIKHKGLKDIKSWFCKLNEKEFIFEQYDGRVGKCRTKRIVQIFPNLTAEDITIINGG